jgi:hypothetical protein
VKVNIYLDRYGKIVSLVEVKDDSEAPSAGIFPIPGCESYEVELTDEQAEQQLIFLHTNYELDRSEEKPRLVRIRRERRQS